MHGSTCTYTVYAHIPHNETKTPQIIVNNAHTEKKTCRAVDAKVNRNGRNTSFSTISFLPHKLHIQTFKILPYYAITNASLQTLFARALPAALFPLSTLPMPSADC